MDEQRIEVPVVDPDDEVHEMKISQTSNPSMTWPPPYSVESDYSIHYKRRLFETMMKNHKLKVLRKRQKLLKKQRKMNRKRR